MPHPHWGADLLWLAVALSVVVAVRETAPLGALVSMALGAAVFTLGHAPRWARSDGHAPPRHRMDRVPPSSGRHTDSNGQKITHGICLSRCQRV
jgi:hypothetical protein